MHSQTSMVQPLKYGKWISHFIPYFTRHVITLIHARLKLIHVSERVPGIPDICHSERGLLGDKQTILRAIAYPWTGFSCYEPVVRFTNPDGFWPDINIIYDGISLLKFMMLLKLLSLGYQCASKNHSHHRDVTDSVYWGDIYQTKFFQALQERGAYINQPDTYFYAGGSKTGECSENIGRNLIWYQCFVVAAWKSSTKHPCREGPPVWRDHTIQRPLYLHCIKAASALAPK